MKLLDYYSIKNFNVNISIKHLNVIDIISYSCEQTITDWNISSNKANLDISLYFKILYTTKDSNALNILKHNSYCHDIIPLKNTIDGFNLHNLLNRKRIYPISNVHSLSLINASKEYLSLALLLINEIKILRSLSIIYVISDNDNNFYLYASDIYFNKFTQLTFYPKNYDNICFSSHDESFFYNNDNTIYRYSLENNTDTPILQYNCLLWFHTLDNNTLLICKHYEQGIDILIKNIVKKDEQLVYRCTPCSTCFSFVLSCNILSFIQIKDDSKYLIILNIYGDIILNTLCNFNKLYINSSATTILAIENSSLTLIDINTKKLQSISIPLPNFVVSDIVFLCDTTSVICGYSGDISHVLLLDFNTLLFTDIFNGEFVISSISCDDIGNIFISSNELGLFNIYTIFPNKKSKLSLKLFATKLSILIRK